MQGASAISSLVIQSGVANAIGDNAALSLFAGGAAGVADQGYVELGAGIEEAIGALLLEGVMQPTGTYGSSASAATYKLDEYFAGTGMLLVGDPILAGDYNADGYVDAADFVVWQKNRGTTNPLPNDNGIGGEVGVAHYELWMAHFGESASGGASLANLAAVPEPTAMAIFAWGVLLAVGRRRALSRR